MRVPGHRRRRKQHAVAFVGQAVAIGVHLPRRQQVGLPGADAVGVGFELLQASGRQQVGKSAAVVGKRKVVRLVERRLERVSADKCPTMVHASDCLMKCCCQGLPRPLPPTLPEIHAIDLAGNRLAVEKS